MLWSDVPVGHTVADVPKIRAEDRQFALRLGGVLRELRRQAGWTQAQAAEKLGLVEGTLGRWERGDFAPKGYDLGRLFRGYEPYGADWAWFFDPPEVVVVNPVRASLDARAATATSAADEREARAAERRRRAGGQPGDAPGKRPT